MPDSAGRPAGVARRGGQKPDTTVDPTHLHRASSAGRGERGQSGDGRTPSSFRPTAADTSAVGGRRPRATLDSVASLAGVSRQTVSNVVNLPHLVRDDTAARVRSAIEELSYRPHLAAQQLRTRKSALLGMRVHSSPEPTVFDRFLHAVTEAAAERDYRIILYTAADDDVEIDSYNELLDRWNVDGLLLSYTHAGDRRTQYLAGQQVPFVTFGRPWDTATAHHWVDVDGCAGTRTATRYLMSQGHSRIGFLGWPESSEVGNDRLSGWAGSVTAAGLGAPEPARCENDFDTARAAANDLLRHNDVTAIVCVSDVVALGALAAAQDRGMEVGSELAITGFDDSDRAVGADLTSLRQPLQQVAQHCVRIVLSQVSPTTTPIITDHGHHAQPPEQVLLAPTLTVRASTGRAPEG